MRGIAPINRINRTHSRRFARSGDARAVAKRLECVRLQRRFPSQAAIRWPGRLWSLPRHNIHHPTFNAEKLRTNRPLGVGC